MGHQIWDDNPYEAGNGKPPLKIEEAVKFSKCPHCGAPVEYPNGCEHCKLPIQYELAYVAKRKTL